MPLPKYNGPHIVGDDGSDESPPFSPPSVLMADEELSESSSEESSSDDSTESEVSIESTSSERSPVLGENENQLIASYLVPVVMPPDEDYGPIIEIDPTAQQQDAPDGDLANAEPSLPQIGSIMQDAPINGDMANLANAEPSLPQIGSIMQDAPINGDMANLANAEPSLPQIGSIMQDAPINGDMANANANSMSPLTEVDFHGYCNTVYKTTASTQTSESDIENDMPSNCRRRTTPASFEDPESIGARVSKRGRCSTSSGKSIELAKPLDVTNYFQEVSALFVRERVELLAFAEYCKISDRALMKAVARSKQRQEQGRK
ncbi:uncharacterized protein [Drosophila pseudoobscura]|uniref:Uncharacterized protein isoform X2 n=1 Tax=Drosophila pseudoobscura pseudoobscura TaxID=46245 RepID=A0A6I8V890_DROPS|nr:uncharacterized protein LOC6902866 isoform X2 [Drosophila pseudoobscura]XP_015035886.2 uncharacterized protein LOC6902866 isoform X3 [Drosophila pseudoobscura]